MAVLLLERGGCGLKIACLSRARLPRLPISLIAPGARGRGGGTSRACSHKTRRECPRRVKRTAPTGAALKLQRPLPDGALKVVARGEREDQVVI